MSRPGARNAFTTGGSAPTARDYVQNGLVAMWDGIENAGWGVHDAATTVWKDLAGDNNFQNFDNGVFWGDNFFGTSSLLKCATASLYDENSIKAMECGVALNGWYGLVLAQFASNSNSPGRWFGFRSDGTFNFADRGDCAAAALSVDTISVFSGVFENGWTLYKDGVSVTSLGAGMYWSDYTGGESSINTVSSYMTSSKIYFMRLYSRALTSAEIAHNYAVDKARFNLP